MSKQTLKEAIASHCLQRETVTFVKQLKLDAQRTKRTMGQPTNPFKAIEGLEKEFERAEKTIRYCDNILKEIEKNRERKRRLRRAAHFFGDAAAVLVALVICAGLIGAVCFGLATICAMFEIPLWVIMLALVAGSLIVAGASWK